MGPGDPFGKSGAARTQVRPASESESSSNSDGKQGGTIRSDEIVDAFAKARRSRPFIVGMALGALVGVLLLFGVIVEGLFVIICALAGGVAAFVGHGLFTGRFDFGAAWRALRGGR